MKKILLLLLLLNLLSSCETNKKHNEFIDYSNYSYLSDSNKEKYDSIYNDIKLQKNTKVDENILKYVLLDHPEFYHISIENKFLTYSMTKEEYYFELKEYQDKALSLKGSTTKETIENIYLYIINNSSYDHSLSGNNFYSNNFTGKSGNCYGYAKGVKLLLDFNNIDNIIVNSMTYQNDSNGSHAFNIVNLNDKDYIIDTTWDDQIYRSGYYNEEISIPLYNYFLVDLPITHIPEKQYPLFKYDTTYKIDSINIENNEDRSTLLENINNSTNKFCITKIDKDNRIDWNMITLLNKELNNNVIIEYSTIINSDKTVVIFIIDRKENINE